MLLEIIICLSFDETKCKTIDMPLDNISYGLVDNPTVREVSMTECMAKAGLGVAQVVKDYPKYRVTNWKCKT
jgi:hypothetical protein